jgi:hypothetical protein
MEDEIAGDEIASGPWLASMQLALSTYLSVSGTTA